MKNKCYEGRSLWAALVLLVVTALITPVPSALGGETETFGISPHPETRQGIRRSLRFGLSPGSSAKDAVRIYNKTDRRLKLVVYVSDASRSPDGTVNIPPTGSTPTAAGGWMTLEATEVVLAAKQERVLTFTITRPQGAQGGGLAAIVAEEADSAAKPGESVEIVTRVALLLRVGEVSEAELRVTSVAIRPVIRFIPEKAQVWASLSNQTDRPITVSVFGEVRSLTGRKYRLEARSIELDASETRRISTRWDTVPRFGGLMRATIRVVHTEGEVSSSSPLEPVVPIWLLLLVIAVEAWILARRIRRKD